MLPGFSPEATDLLQNLLMRNPEQRIGYSREDAQEIMDHPFFSSIDWEDLESQEVEPPYIPCLHSKEDTSNIDRKFTEETPTRSQVLGSGASQGDNFSDFSFA